MERKENSYLGLGLGFSVEDLEGAKYLSITTNYRDS